MRVRRGRSLSIHLLYTKKRVSETGFPKRLLGMTKNASEWLPGDVELRKKLDAVGAANKWLRTSLSKERGRYVGERDVVLLLCPVHENPGPGRVWVAVLYTAENPDVGQTRGKRGSEWTGKNWRTALTSALYDLLDHDVLEMAERYSDTSWFMFEDIWGNEVNP